MERYYAELQQLVSKERKQDSELMRRAKQFVKRRKGDVNKSLVFRPLQETALSRKVEHFSGERENEEEARNDFLEPICFSGGAHKK